MGRRSVGSGCSPSGGRRLGVVLGLARHKRQALALLPVQSRRLPLVVVKPERAQHRPAVVEGGHSSRAVGGLDVWRLYRAVAGKARGSVARMLTRSATRLAATARTARLQVATVPPDCAAEQHG